MEDEDGGSPKTVRFDFRCSEPGWGEVVSGLGDEGQKFRVSFADKLCIWLLDPSGTVAEGGAIDGVVAGTTRSVGFPCSCWER